MNRLKPFILLLSLCLHPLIMQAQDMFGNNTGNGFGNQTDDFDETRTNNRGQKRSTWGRDTSKVEKTVPTEFFQWRIDERLGTVQPEEYNDTLPHLFQNYDATEGPTFSHMFLGNLGAPRLALNFLDRYIHDNYTFIQPYDFFHTSPSSLLFTNTKSPLTNLQYHKCGTKENGQDRVLGYFASNINKRSAIGFKLDYLYGRGYYNDQANSQFGGTIFGYYRGERYEMHAMASWEHMKMGENGGIENDTYITDPQSFPQTYESRDIPTILSSVYNRNDQKTYFLTHRYNLGFEQEIELPDSLKPKMPSDQTLLKSYLSDSLRQVVKADSTLLIHTLDSLRGVWQAAQVAPTEFVPVTSIIHTFKYKRLTHDNYSRGTIPSNYFSHAPYYRTSPNKFMDETWGESIKNTVGLQLREGFNKWAKAGISLFVSDELEHFSLPAIETFDGFDFYDRYTENNVTVGGEIQKTQGSLIHFNAGAEFWVLGSMAGDLDIHGTGDLNFRLGRDTVNLSVTASFMNIKPGFYFEHYHSQYHWWDNSLNQETRTRLEGSLSLKRTRTKLRFGVENISNYTHYAALLTPIYNNDSTKITSYSHDVEVRQQSGSIQVLSATLSQGLKLRFFHWDTEVTWQQSSKKDVLPLPTIFLYTNPYVIFHIAKVLRVELGVDMRFHTKYYAPDYAPFLNQFCVQDASQERIKIGGHPILNGYANFAIKRVRGYINVTHFNAGGNAFWAPHYPIDPMSIHFGISWNFYD